MEAMIRLKFTDKEFEDIAEAVDDPETCDRAKLKLMAIRLHALGTPHGHIAVALNVSADSVTNYCKAYRDGGISALLENRHYRPTSASKPFLGEILRDLQANPVATVKEAAHRIEKITNIAYSETQTRRILKALGLAYRKTASIPGKADPQLQFAFLQEELMPRLEEARQGKRRVFFVDAAHFVLGAFLGMIWCLSRVFIRAGSGRQRYSVLGAIETRDHDLVSVRTSGSVNAQSVCQLIERIAAQYPGETITLVMDNARYQRCALVRETAERLGTELLFLPPYSPNLNLIERVWRLVKTKTLRNRYFPDFASFTLSIDTFIDSLAHENRHILKSLVTHNFQTFDFPRN